MIRIALSLQTDQIIMAWLKPFTTNYGISNTLPIPYPSGLHIFLWIVCLSTKGTSICFLIARDENELSGSMMQVQEAQSMRNIL